MYHYGVKTISKRGKSIIMCVPYLLVSISKHPINRLKIVKNIMLSVYLRGVYLLKN